MIHAHSTVNSDHRTSLRRGQYLAFAVVASLCVCSFAAAQTNIEQLEQQALYDAAAKVAPYVVRIETIGGLEKVGKVLTNMGPTSGVIVGEDGYIISSEFNFIQKPSSILVQLPSGKRKSAKVVSKDQSRKLVLLKIDVDEPLNVPEAAAKESIHVGEWAVTVGRTLPGEAFNMSVGIVSAKNRIWGRAIQTDANVSPANYGGALVDIEGKVIGVLAPLSPDSNAVVAGSEWYDSGIGFCIPFQDILDSLDRLKEGDLNAGKLGVAMKGANAYADELIVALSRPKSPARDARIVKGDKILSINGVEVSSHAQMKHVLGPLLAGETVRIVYQRKGKTFEEDVVLTDKLEPYVHPFLGILPAREPNVIGDQDREEAGVPVRYVYEDSPASKIGIKAGDVILRLNDEEVADVVELRNAIAAIEPDEEVSIAFRSGEEERERTPTLAALPIDLPDEIPAAFPDIEEFNDDLPQLGKVNVKLPEEEGDCVAYVPETYDPRFAHSLLVVLPPPGKVDIKELIKSWKSFSEDNRTILLMPQAKLARSWMPTETKFIRKTIENVRKDYLIDSERIAVYGADNSGSMAFLTAFSHRDLIRGTVTFNAAVPSRAPVYFNEPLQRYAAFMIGAEESRSAKRIKANMESLREAKVPVTERTTADENLSDDLKAEVMRWLDTLDRI